MANNKTLKTGARGEIRIFRACDVPKGWGKEVQIINKIIIPGENFPTGYAGKLLVYEKDGAISSMHLHGVKWETFYQFSGEFLLRYINPENAEILEVLLKNGDVVDIPPLCQHQLKCIKAGIIIEFSSTDRSWDNYRVIPGDSQNQK